MENSPQQTLATPVGPRNPAAEATVGTLRLHRLEIDDSDWLQFAAAHSAAVLFHHPAWGRLLADCYGYRAFALAAKDESGRIRAGVPIVEVSGLLQRKRWVALPFTDSCDALVSDDLGAAFADELDRFRADSGIARLEVRGEAVRGGFRSEAGTIHRLDLTPGLEALHSGFSKSRVRPEIKRAIREGVTVREAATQSDVTAGFYDLHLATRRRQGVPVQPRRFFELLWDRILEPGHGFVLLADLGGRPIAGAVFLAWNGTVIYKYAASDETQRWARPNHLLLWEAIRRSHEAGAHTLDFGRTDPENEGLRKFKAGWGAREAALVYTTFAASAPAPGAQGSHRLQAVLRGTIRRSPAWVCRAIGAAAYRYVA